VGGGEAVAAVVSGGTKALVVGVDMVADVVEFVVVGVVVDVVVDTRLAATLDVVTGAKLVVVMGAALVLGFSTSELPVALCAVVVVAPPPGFPNSTQAPAAIPRQRTRANAIAR
jgi:hypothetical protein